MPIVSELGNCEQDSSRSVQRSSLFCSISVTIATGVGRQRTYHEPLLTLKEHRKLRYSCATVSFSDATYVFYKSRLYLKEIAKEELGSLPSLSITHLKAVFLSHQPFPPRLTWGQARCQHSLSFVLIFTQGWPSRHSILGAFQESVPIMPEDKVSHLTSMYVLAARGACCCHQFGSSFFTDMIHSLEGMMSSLSKNISVKKY